MTGATEPKEKDLSCTLAMPGGTRASSLARSSSMFLLGGERGGEKGWTRGGDEGKRMGRVSGGEGRGERKEEGGRGGRFEENMRVGDPT